MGCSPVNPEQYESRFPDNLAGFWVWCLLPDISIPILGSCYDLVGIGSPVDGRNNFVVLCTSLIVSDRPLFWEAEYL